MSVVLVYGRTHIMRIYAWYIKATYIHARIYLDGARFPHLRGARFSDRNLFPHLNGEASLKALDICSASAATSSSRPAMDSASASSPTFRDRFPHLYNNNVRESACLLYCVNKIRFHHFHFHPVSDYIPLLALAFASTRIHEHINTDRMCCSTGCFSDCV